MNDVLLWVTMLVAVLVSAVAALWSVWPVLKPGRAQLVTDDDRLTDLLGRKDAALTAIKDLEFDYRVGKMDEEDYQRVNDRLRRQAIALMEQLDKLVPESTPLDTAFEAEIAKQRKTAPRRAPAPAKAAGTVAVTPTPAPVNGYARPRFCTNCGHELDATHKFCANCGTPVTEVATADSETV